MEGSLHKFLKDIVAKELKKQEYLIYFEPLESPFDRLWWEYYRPDILAIKSWKKNLNIILVECETKPNMKRLLQKTDKLQKFLSLQKKLHEKTTIIPILVIPPNNLKKIISLKIRRIWEIWIINDEGKILHKIVRCMI
ncbi:hypothetical protein KJN74_05815 [Candidatus Bathyarchaeota archaeon]|nr:hypothetical protein [Candidatus Bathyarchaeota archaeon]